jgi:hypothetical protein
LHGTEPRGDDYPGPTGGFTLPLPAPNRAAIQAAVEALVPAGKKSVLPATGRPSPKFDVDFEGTRGQKYVVRCVYLRKDCPPVVSAASEPFSIAAIHDPDAPARTIRIPMPVDISVNGLRNLKKNVGFVLSKELNARVQSLSGKKLKQIDEGDVSDGGIGLAEICTFAMPIIMICAMIVLFIFLVLLNIVFFWMPFLKICLPIPKAKP